jgi:hypothetical protein
MVVVRNFFNNDDDDYGSSIDTWIANEYEWRKVNSYPNYSFCSLFSTDCSDCPFHDTIGIGCGSLFSGSVFKFEYSEVVVYLEDMLSMKVGVDLNE